MNKIEEKRQREISIVTKMRFCGPRMLLYYPLATIRHLIESIKEKRKLEKQK